VIWFFCVSFVRCLATAAGPTPSSRRLLPQGSLPARINLSCDLWNCRETFVEEKNAHRTRFALARVFLWLSRTHRILALTNRALRRQRTLPQRCVVPARTRHQKRATRAARRKKTDRL